MDSTVIQAACLVLALLLLGSTTNGALYQQQPQVGYPMQQPDQKQSQQQPPQMQPETSSNKNGQQESSSHLSTRQQPNDRDWAIFRYHGPSLNSTSVKLVWNLVSGYHADYFEIQWGPIETSAFPSVKLNGSARDYTFNGLQPETLYQFHLFGFNGDHTYKPQLVAVQTPPVNYAGQPVRDLVNRDIMPVGVKAEARSNNSIQLSWTEADKPANFKNSNRINFIRYYINSAGNLQSTNESVTQQQQQPQYHYLNVTNARDSRLIVQKLKPATEYAFAVKTAYYSPDMKKLYTQSGFSMDTIAKTHDLEPTAPRNFSIQVLPPTKEELIAGQPSKLELSWQAPEVSNGQLRGYEIRYAFEPQAPDDQWHKINVSDPNVNNWRVVSLRPSTSYYFKIRANNQRGFSPDSETRLYVAPPAASLDKTAINAPIPPNNVLLLIVICMVAILFLLFVVVSHLACKTRRKPRNKANLKNMNQSGDSSTTAQPKLNGFTSTNSSTVAGRVGTLARRAGRGAQSESGGKAADFWISAMDPAGDKQSILAGHQPAAPLEKGDLSMAMVSIQRDSPHFATTQLAPSLPEYRQFGGANNQTDHQMLMQQLQQQQQSHYHPAQFAYDQMDNATASALMTLSKRQQQQMQKYQIQFAQTGVAPNPALSMANSNSGPQTQAPSPNQQPPPPPPLNIEQQQQSLYGVHQPLASSNSSTRSLRLHRPTVYDPVSGSFVQTSEAGPPNYNAHHVHNLLAGHQNQPAALQFGTATSNTLQFHPHQTSTLMSRRSSNTFRSFQNSTYGQLLGAANNHQQFGVLPAPPSSLAGGQQQQQQPQQLLQSHQSVINQLNNSTYPSLPLKHVSTVKPQIMSNLEDQIEMELAEKEQQDQQQKQQQSTIKQ